MSLKSLSSDKDMRMTNPERTPTIDPVALGCTWRHEPQAHDPPRQISGQAYDRLWPIATVRSELRKAGDRGSFRTNPEVEAEVRAIRARGVSPS